MNKHYLLEAFVTEQALQLMTVEEAVKQHKKDHHLPDHYCAELLKNKYRKEKSKLRKTH